MSKSNETTPNVPTLRFPNYSGEWQVSSMGKVCTFRKGYGISKENLSSDGTPCVLYGELYTTYKTAIAKRIKSKTSLDPTTLFHSKKNDVIIPCSGETAEDIATSVCIPYDDILLGGDLTVIRGDLDGAFLSNQINSVRKYDIARIAQGKSIVHLQADELKKISIAYPTIEEQQKISGFIDKIDERIEVQNKIISKYETLIKGLSYYIIKKFNGKEYKLGTLAEIYQPQTITKTDLPDNGKYPVYGANGIIGYYNRFNHKESQIMITCRGSTCGTVNLSTPYSWITGNSMVINIDEHKSTVDKKYLYYYLKTQSFNDLISGSGQPQIVRKPLVNLNVFLPEISQQIKLGEIIDIFEKTLKNEKEMLSALQKQKAFLLQSMFI